MSITLEVKKDFSYFLNRILYTGKIFSCSLSQRASELPSGHHQISKVVAVPTAVSQKDIRVRDTQIVVKQDVVDGLFDTDKHNHRNELFPRY